MAKKYVVELTVEERSKLESLVGNNKTGRQKLLHAYVLLKADEMARVGWKDAQIVEAYQISERTVQRIRQKFVEEGLEAVLNRKPSERVYLRKFDGEQEAHLIATACSPPPEGHARWTLKLLGDKMVSLGFFDSVDPETVRQVLKKRAKTLAK